MAPAFIASAHIGTSPWPVIKTSCSSRPPSIRAFWKSIPFSPGICTSTITHEGPGCAERERNSEADLKSSVSYWATSNKRLRLFRIDASSSITNTIALEVIIVALPLWLADENENALRLPRHFRLQYFRHVL